MDKMLIGESLPRISIVTPSLNQGRFLADAIESVTGQAYPNVEHIVVDAQSTDETLAVLRGYEHLEHLQWTSEPDRGQTDAINKGFRRATGDIVAWLNADDFYLPGTFDRVARAFRSDPPVDVVYGDVDFVAADGQRIRTLRNHRFDYQVLLYWGCFIQSTATFFHRRIVDAGDLLDDSFKVTMDYEYFVRLANREYRFRHVPHVLAGFRWHGDNISALHGAARREERLRVQHAHGLQWVTSSRLRTLLFDAAYPVFRLKRLALKGLARATPSELT